MAKNFINAKLGSPSALLTRKDVPEGTIFLVKGQNTPYATMGRRSSPPSNDTRWMSKNLVTGVTASTDNGDSKVTIVGTYEIVASFAPGYEDLVDLVNNG